MAGGVFIWALVPSPGRFCQRSARRRRRRQNGGVGIRGVVLTVSTSPVRRSEALCAFKGGRLWLQMAGWRWGRGFCVHMIKAACLSCVSVRCHRYV